ncbi:DUF6058 family natural product biosynthesis protein [Massilia sp. IC2-477]|uniref:DUF6058 family natural product biosynthesis protein n=1 Tax=Massilia sp. IC2-477 TaxID=2887198 RepID=UPI001D121C3F|nr:DUF6058 family natural product biosynthesis protein [Massilia sp. IC2-477]MCC2956372.1 DUF6058 family natural product biosynthesis protein [Massilia sp. IC2-477]
MELLDYLKQHFLTRAQLLAASGITSARLDALTEGGGMPRPSYRIRLDLRCASFFGEHDEEASAEYYATGYPSWIGVLEATAEDPFTIFARRYRTALASLPLTTTDPTLGDGLDAHLRDEWGHFLAGTYGLCTRSGLPEDIAAKELAICVIKKLTAIDNAQPDRRRLRQAVDLLDRASTPFAPHERARSSRHRYVDAMRLRYGLPTP